jgi:hypothetical protein
MVLHTGDLRKLIAPEEKVLPSIYARRQLQARIGWGAAIDSDREVDRLSASYLIALGARIVR